MNLETQHSFDIAIASIVGVNKAIILKEVMGWCEQNRRNGRNLHEGEYWTYNTAEAYAAKFPYMKAKSIARWMNELVAKKWLFKGQFGKAGYDRTLSHRVNRSKYLKALQTFISQNEECISQNEETITSLSLNPEPKKLKLLIVAPELDDITKMIKEKLSKLPKTTTPDEWAKWEANSFFNYWEGKKWKDKGKSIVPNLSRRIATWIRRGAEKAKYTKPAPGSKSYGEFRTGNQAPQETKDIQLSEAWEGSYQRFTTALKEAMGNRASMVSPLTRSQYLAWSTHKKRPLTGRLNERNLHKTLIRWAKNNTSQMNSYVLQRELKTADAFLWHAYTEFLKDTGRWGEYNEPNGGQYPETAKTQAA